MRLAQLDDYFRSILDIRGMAASDDSLNGLQVGDVHREVSRVAFAVDACLETFAAAKAWGAELLFVHHGLFWGRPQAVTGPLWERIAFLVKNDVALYACHLPLDAHPEVGNNAVLAHLLRLTEIEPFGEYHGQRIGCRGRFAAPIPLDEAIARILPDGGRPVAVYPFGPEKITTAACVSGGAAFEAFQALALGLDLYVTGEPSHTLYHHVKEGRMSMIAAGHYATEVWGVKALAERLARDTGLTTHFVDVPTGQ